MINIHKAITTVMGLGYAPIAPGTFGTIGAVIFYYLLSVVLSADINAMALALFVMAVFWGVIGIYSTNKVIPLWGDDPSRVVMDEFVGYLITMIMIPFAWNYAVIGFILFRFFDILKPLGVGYLDKNLKGGMGVMMDDVLAGVYACLCLHLYLYVEPMILG